MQCVEFESRLNDLLDDRLAPSVDHGLFEHAQNCPGCFELLAAHEVLLEGVQALPAVRLCDAEQRAFAHRVVVEVGNAPCVGFPAATEVELVECGPTIVARNAVTPLAIIGLVLATAAALLIAFLPNFRDHQQPADPAGKQQWIVGNQDRPLPESPGPEVPLKDYADLALIARVGYQVADRLTPVTNSMVSALRELRKRPFFRNTDEPQRSSFYSRVEADEMLA
ncbi:MAG: hypothetical protein WD894_25885 [Pirellulales bacterium]